jgi:hypothetical protein
MSTASMIVMKDDDEVPVTPATESSLGLELGSPWPMPPRNSVISAKNRDSGLLSVGSALRMSVQDPSAFASDAEAGHATDTDTMPSAWGPTRSATPQPHYLRPPGARPRPSRMNTTTSSFIWRRWSNMVSGASRKSFLKWRNMGKQAYEDIPPPACLLFWAGFVAGPWCWLVGGWVCTTDHVKTKFDAADVERTERSVLFLPLWAPIPKVPALSSAPPSGQTGSSTLAATPVGQLQEARVLEQPEAVSQQSKTPATRWEASPWVRRCRIAAVASGTLIFLALIISLIVLAGTR